jgi:addiction module RelB/DinJ family antitoxin
MAVVQVSARVDKEIKEEANSVFAYYGLDIPTVIRMVLTTAAHEKCVPLDLKKPQISYDGDSFPSDYEYFKQIPGFLDMLEREAQSTERYTREEVGL